MKQRAGNLGYGRRRGRRRGALFGTICGLLIGMAAIAIWMLTFSPHGGVKWSAFLFPVSVVVLEWLYPTQSVPVGLFYGGALLQWVLMGVLVDVVRMFIRRRAVGKAGNCAEYR